MKQQENIAAKDIFVKIKRTFRLREKGPLDQKAARSLIGKVPLDQKGALFLSGYGSLDQKGARWLTVKSPFYNKSGTRLTE